MLKVKDHPNLIRDPNSKAIINISQSELAEFQQKNNIQKKVKELTEQMHEMKNDFSEIKSLLQQLVSRGQ